MGTVRRFRVPALALVVVALAATASLAGPSSSVSPEGSDGPERGERPARVERGADGDVGVVPDHSACRGLTGLENAACRVRANLAAHPNRGLENALSRLESKLASKGSNGHGPPDHARGLEVAAAHGAPVASG